MDYNYNYYQNQINYFLCKKNVFSNQLTADETDFLKGFSEKTLEVAISECDDVYIEQDNELTTEFSDLDSKEDKYLKAMDNSREITKTLNELYSR